MKSIVLCASICTLLFCLKTNRATAQTEAEMKAWMAYMTPGDMHKLLADMEGVFSMEGKMWMDPKAQPMTSSGEASYKMILGGRYQESDFKGNFMGQPFEGKGVIAYDNLKKRFESTWMDNMGTGLMKTEGQFDPATKTFTMKGTMVDPMTGKDCAVRETLQIVDNDTHVMTMYNAVGSQPEFKTMEMTFKRKK